MIRTGSFAPNFGVLFATPIALAAGFSPAFTQDLEDLRPQIEAMKAKIAKLEADNAKKRRVAAAQSIEASDKPKSWKLPGTNTSMQIGGYAKLDLLYDFNGFLGDQIALNSVPLRGTAAANRQGNFRLHARQSRIVIKTWTPTDWGELATYIEADFFANAGNNTGDPGFRLRHAYGRLGPVLAGRNWSTFQPVQYAQESLDFTGPSGQVFIRQAMLRYTHALAPGVSLIFALEDPSAGAAGQTANATILPIGPGVASGSVSAANSGPNFVPDFVAVLHWRGSWGGLYLSGLLRGLSYNDGAGGAAPGPGFDDRTVGWGISLAANTRSRRSSMSAAVSSTEKA